MMIDRCHIEEENDTSMISTNKGKRDERIREKNRSDRGARITPNSCIPHPDQDHYSRIEKHTFLFSFIWRKSDKTILLPWRTLKNYMNNRCAS